MGSRDYYPEESPVHSRTVTDLWVDLGPVTNGEFGDFADATGHVTVAERTPSAADFPDADPEQLVPGSLVFTPPPAPVPLDDWTRWWHWVPGASWRHPLGPGSDVGGRQDHPVVHVGFEDALAYAEWVGKRLPTEAEWEHAARGGLPGATYAWGSTFRVDGRSMANTFHGDFPWRPADPDGFDRTSPVGAFPPNGYGLFDMIGNVWEWTSTPWSPRHRSAAAAAPVVPEASTCCGGAMSTPIGPIDELTQRVTKGGSHLCAPSYCRRYRPAARQGHQVRSTASHLGFRCVRAA
jgi:formylglycine-generating enzyme required for sulfatase activity